LNGFFACVSYVILIVDFLQKAFEGLFGLEVSRPVLVWGSTIFFLLPLSHARNLSALRFTSILGLGIIGLVFAYVVMDFIGGLPANFDNLSADLFRIDMGIFSTVAICTGAFKAHYNAPKFFSELGCDLTAHTRMVAISFSAAFAVYSSFALAGLGLFGEGVLGNLLRNYSAEGNTPILMAWLGMAFAIIFTYPLVFSSARDSLLGMSGALQNMAKSRPGLTHVGATSIMVSLISVLACFLEDVSVVTGLLGATIGSCLCWIFPAFIYLRAARGSSDLERPLLTGAPKMRLKGSAALKGYAALIALFGTASMCIGLGSVFGVL
jgi:sodium-coupled neutral amino acid transporter 10